LLIGLIFFFFFFNNTLVNQNVWFIFAVHLQSNNVERAADWIFSHADELDQPDEVPMETQAGAAAHPDQSKFRDGPGGKFLFLLMPIKYFCCEIFYSIFGVVESVR
jgi:hypothetical protein